MKFLLKFKDKLIAGVQWLIKSLEFVIGLVNYINTALKALRKLLDFLKTVK